MQEKDKGTLFPTIEKSIQNFIEDEEGSIPAGKLLAVGTLVVLLGTIFTMDVFAAHSSHSSHKSHSSHSSHSSSSTHSNSTHSNHYSHSSHVSHSSHTSHSNTASHSNSNYSAAGDLGTPTAPDASTIKAPETVQGISTTFANVSDALDNAFAVSAIPEIQTPQAVNINVVPSVINPEIQEPDDTPIPDTEIKSNVSMIENEINEIGEKLNNND